MLKISAKLIGIFKSNDYTDRDTGKTTIGKTKLQLQTTRTMQDESTKVEVLDISIPDDKVSQYKSKVGQSVEVSVGAIGKVTYYGI
jgi:hypothetical protein